MKRILVLGASGYVGSQLIPLLLDHGYDVVATARNVAYLQSRFHQHPHLKLQHLDLAHAEAVNEIVPHFDIVFFLVHGMAQGHDFINYELTLASHVRDALNDSSVQHVIYLSAIQPHGEGSLHTQARAKTGQILRQSSVPVTELRAGVIIGPGSAAFEIMRDFVYNLPLLIAPKWVDSQANPIALENLNHYLLCLIHENPNTHAIYEAGGPDILSYREQFKILCDIANKPFHLYSTAILTPRMASYWLTLVTSVPKAIGRSLLDGLSHDYIADNTELQQRFPQTLISYREAAQAAIAQEGTFVRSKVWGYDPAALHRWQAGFGFYPKQAGASLVTEQSAEALWQVIRRIGSREQGYFFANLLWRIREWGDVLFGGSIPVRRSPSGPELKVGDYIDSWKVIRCEPQCFLSLFFGMKAPGLGRLEFTITELSADQRRLDIRAWWHPKGFAGLLYWFAMMPAHLFIFKGMVRAIERKARGFDSNLPIHTDHQ